VGVLAHRFSNKYWRCDEAVGEYTHPTWEFSARFLSVFFVASVVFVMDQVSHGIGLWNQEAASQLKLCMKRDSEIF
jgi:hypothetical protein